MKPTPLGRSPRAAGRVRDFRSGRDATRPTEVTPVSERGVGGVGPPPPIACPYGRDVAVLFKMPRVLFVGHAGP